MGANVVQKAPNGVIALCVTSVVLALIGAFTALAYAGKDTQQLAYLLNALMSSLGFLTGTGAFLYAGAAAKSSAQTEENTNGELTRRIHAAVANAMREAQEEERGTT